MKPGFSGPGMFQQGSFKVIPLMEEILHHLGCLKLKTQTMGKTTY